MQKTYGDDPKKARPHLRQLIHDYRFSGYSLFRKIADVLDYHYESIINSFIVIERMCAGLIKAGSLTALSSHSTA